jgi:hypothetical protein
MTRITTGSIIDVAEGCLTLDNAPLPIVDGLLARGGSPLVDALRRNIDAGEAELERIVSNIQADSAAHSILLYRLAGAVPEVCTPMEYGGYFLERDRELLATLVRRAVVILYVQGGPGVYLDFVSDLSAEVLAWNQSTTGVSVSELSKIRDGLMGGNDPEAAVTFSIGATDLLEGMSIG